MITLPVITAEGLVPSLVSVIVPVYNAEKYLEACLGSALGQSYQPLELILINDGSTDNSGPLCEAFAQKYGKVKVIHSRNRGPGAARNTGIHFARGEFIFFLDADDTLNPNAITLVHEQMQNTGSDLALGNFARVKPEGRVVNPDRPPKQLLEGADLTDYMRFYLKRPNKCTLFGVSWSRLFKTRIIRRERIAFDESLRTHEDVAFCFDYMRHIRRMSFLTEAIYNYKVASYSSATMSIGNDPRQMCGYITALRHVRACLKEHGVPEQDLEQETGHAFVWLTCHQLVRICGQYTESNKQLLYTFAEELVKNPQLKASLPHFVPPEDIDPQLARLLQEKQVFELVHVCRDKAYAKYGRPAEQ